MFSAHRALRSNVQHAVVVCTCGLTLKDTEIHVRHVNMNLKTVELRNGNKFKNMVGACSLFFSSDRGVRDVARG